VCMCLFMCVYVCLCVYMCVYVSVYVCLCVYMCVYVSVYVCMCVMGNDPRSSRCVRDPNSPFSFGGGEAVIPSVYFFSKLFGNY